MTTVQRWSVLSLHTTITGTSHSNQTQMLNRYLTPQSPSVNFWIVNFLMTCCFWSLVGLQVFKRGSENVSGKTHHGESSEAQLYVILGFLWNGFCVKRFLNPAPQARIKAINTFFAKNGYRSMDSSLYAQQSQSQSQYSSPLYMQHVYPQQQYPVYGIVPPTWTPSPTPYFETPLVRDMFLVLQKFFSFSRFSFVYNNRSLLPHVDQQAVQVSKLQMSSIRVVRKYWYTEILCFLDSWYCIDILQHYICFCLLTITCKYSFSVLQYIVLFPYVSRCVSFHQIIVNRPLPDIGQLVPIFIAAKFPKLFIFFPPRRHLFLTAALWMALAQLDITKQAPTLWILLVSSIEVGKFCCYINTAIVALGSCLIFK